MTAEGADSARQTAHAATRELLRGVGPAATLSDHVGDELSQEEVEALHGRLIDEVEAEIKTTLKNG